MTNIILPSDSILYHTFAQLIGSQRLVVFAGLPGVGKSLLSQQLALMAHRAGRNVHLLQWDVARQPFATDPYVLTNYPEVDGVTHAAVRKAMGLCIMDPRI
jgi:adenylylsulfate kinase-like enzyme